MLAEVESQKVIHTVAKVEVEAIVDALAGTQAEEEPGTLS